MLVTGKEILAVANEKGFAVPAFNAGSGQLLNAVIEACEEAQAPVMIAIHPEELKFLTDSFVAQVKYAAEQTDIPICIHLDHGADFNQIIHAIRLGFTSVMIDASHLSYETNVMLSKKVVEAAHASGISVEAELGTIGDTGNTIEGVSARLFIQIRQQHKHLLRRRGSIAWRSLLEQLMESILRNSNLSYDSIFWKRYDH